MSVTQFEGAGPVARYWLAHCEGFAVKGGERGVVEELLRDADPHVTTRLVVRTRGHRRKIVSTAAVSAVVPAEKLVVVERPRRERRVHRRLRVPSGPRLGAPIVAAVARLGPPLLAAGRRLAAFMRIALLLVRPSLEALARSLRALAAEARASAVMLLRDRSR